MLDLSNMFFMDHGLKIVIWNVRGLNSRARRIAIRSLILTTGASIICFQETKMETIYTSTILEALGSDYDDYVYLPAISTRGGILLAWKSREVTITDQTFMTNTLSARVSTPSSATAPWWLTVVYGPQHDDVSLGIPLAWPGQGLDAIGYLQDS